jgi:hypothetical protein
MKTRSLVAIVCFILFSYSVILYAECAKDNIGTVYCAKTPAGGAVADNIGDVLCGKGQCRKNRIGEVYCSVLTGGGADTDFIGSVKCLGGCERGSKYECVKGEN